MKPPKARLIYANGVRLMAESRRLRESVPAALSILLAALSIYFFINALRLITSEQPRVAASILATIIGITLISASVNALKSWVLARRCEG